GGFVNRQRGLTRKLDRTTRGWLLLLRLRLLALDALVDFLAMHRNVRRRVDSDPDVVPFDRKHGTGDLVANHDGFSYSSCENEHLALLESLSNAHRARGSDSTQHVCVCTEGGPTAH